MPSVPLLARAGHVWETASLEGPLQTFGVFPPGHDPSVELSRENVSPLAVLHCGIRCLDSWELCSPEPVWQMHLTVPAAAIFCIATLETSILTSYSGEPRLHFSCKTVLYESRSSAVQKSIVYQHSTICPIRKKKCWSQTNFNKPSSTINCY